MTKLKRTYSLLSILLLAPFFCTMMVSAQSQSADMFKLILSRKSVRKYTGQPVTQAQVDTLLRAAMAAPTAANRQPWKFVVVNKKKVIAKLANGRQPIAGASVCIVVCGDDKKALQSKVLPYWALDCSAATENLLLQAEAMGLGATWCTTTHNEEMLSHVRSVLNLPAHIYPVAAVAIGYPTGVEKAKDKFKPENVFYNSYK